MTFQIQKIHFFIFSMRLRLKSAMDDQISLAELRAEFLNHHELSKVSKNHMDPVN